MKAVRRLDRSLIRLWSTPATEPNPTIWFDPTKAQICCLVHVYYDELWDELANYIRNFDNIPIDLRVNAASAPNCQKTVEAVRKDFPEALVKVSPNQGRDIGGYFALMEDLEFDRYDLVCLMHSKKSPHMPDADGSRWRRELLDAIMRDRQTAATSVCRMMQDPSIGILASARWRRTTIGPNRKKYREFLKDLEISRKNRRCEFVAGSMMLVRSSVLKAIYDTLKEVVFEDGDGLPLRAHLDGQSAHAIERVLGNVARENGLRFAWV